MIIIAATGTKQFPAQVGRWLKTWSSIVNRRTPIVVALFAKPVEEGAPLRAALQQTAMRGGAECFTHTNCGAAWIRHGTRFHTGSLSCLRGGKHAALRASPAVLSSRGCGVFSPPCAQ